MVTSGKVSFAFELEYTGAFYGDSVDEFGRVSDLDLVEVAACFANDDKAAVEQWINDGRVQHLSMATAKDWAAREPELWAVVVAPWVVVQERER